MHLCVSCIGQLFRSIFRESYLFEEHPRMLGDATRRLCCGMHEVCTSGPFVVIAIMHLIS